MKIHLDIRHDISPTIALECVKQVIIQGKVSASGKSYCYATTFDTLEVKEVDIDVDIEKEISKFIDTNFEKATTGHKISLRRTARYFYELGLKAQKGE